MARAMMHNPHRARYHRGQHTHPVSECSVVLNQRAMPTQPTPAQPADTRWRRKMAVAAPRPSSANTKPPG